MINRALHAEWLYGPRLKPVRAAAVALAAGLIGVALGLALANPALAEVVITLIFLGACLLFAMRHPLPGLLLTLVLHPFMDFVGLNLRLPSAGLPNISLTRVVVAGLFALVLAREMPARRPFRRFTSVDGFMLLSTIGLVIAALRATGIVRAMQWVFDMYLASYMVYYITKHFTPDRTRVERVLWALAIIGAYNGVYGIYTQTTGDILFVGPSGLDGPLWYAEGLRIMHGLLDSPHVFGLVFSLAIPVDLYLIVKARSLSTRALAVLMLLVTVGGLFFTYKRTAWIATAASLLVLQFFFPRFRRLFLALLVVVALALFLYSDRLTGSAVLTQRVGDSTNTLNGRLQLWSAALGYAGRAPWLGYGFGNFSLLTSLQAIESNYLWMLVDGGLLALVPFLLIFAALLVTSVRIYRARAPGLFVDRDLVAVFWASLVAYLISLSTVVMNHEFPHMLFFLLAGAVIGSQELLLHPPAHPRPTAAGLSPAASGRRAERAAF